MHAGLHVTDAILQVDDVKAMSHVWTRVDGRMLRRRKRGLMCSVCHLVVDEALVKGLCCTCKNAFIKEQKEEPFVPVAPRSASCLSSLFAFRFCKMFFFQFTAV